VQVAFVLPVMATLTEHAARHIVALFISAGTVGIYQLATRNTTSFPHYCFSGKRMLPRHSGPANTYSELRTFFTY
jgi:hypothetical protein